MSENKKNSEKRNLDKNNSVETSYDVYQNGIKALRDQLKEATTKEESLSLSLTIQERLAYTNPKQTVKDSEGLLDLAQQQGNHYAIARAKNILGYCHTTNYAFDKAEEYLIPNEKWLIENDPNSLALFNTYSYIARLYSLKSEFNQANFFLNQCIDLCNRVDAQKNPNEELDTISLQLNVYGRIVQNHFRVGNLNPARKYIEIALKKDDGKATVNHAVLYNVIGILYAEEEFYDKATQFYEKALNIWEKEGYYFYSSFVYNNIAIIHRDQKHTEEALYYFTKSLELFKKINYRRNIAMVVSNMGDIYLDLNDPHKCIENQEIAMSIYKELNDTHEYLTVILSLPAAYMDLQQYDKALKHLQDAETIQKETNYDKLSYLYPLFIRYYTETEDYKKAFEYQKKYIKYTEKTEEESIQEIEKKYEFVIKEKEVTELNNQQFSLRNHNNDLENFAAKAGHDLKAPIATINMYCHLIRGAIFHKKKEELQNYTEVISTSANSILQLITDLTDYTIAGSNELEKEEFELNDLLFIVENNLQEQITRSNAEIKSSPNLPSIVANYRGMNQIVQNIISNGIKFQKPNNKPLIEVSFNNIEKFTVLEIKDNGIGIAKENHEKVFNVFERLHSKEEYDGSGIGLATCRKIARQMGGDIHLHSEPEIGTTFSILIPK